MSHLFLVRFAVFIYWTRLTIEKRKRRLTIVVLSGDTFPFLVQCSNGGRTAAMLPEFGFVFQLDFNFKLKDTGFNCDLILPEKWFAAQRK